MSGDTVTGQALQFTNDNKHCYAYSGIINASGETTYLDFMTGSEYIKSKIQALTDQANGDDFNITIYINDIIVGVAHAFFYSNSTYVVDPVWRLIIPPLSHVKITITNINNADEWAVMLTGKVGMPQRVGNLDDE